MDGRTINVALIESKFMGRTHSNAYLKVAKFFDLPLQPVMHTVAGRDEEHLKVFAPRWGWKTWTSDWKLAAENPEIELVDIVTPNHVHHEQAIAALEAGKHVACEKPLADTLDHAREMVKAAKAARKCKTFAWFNYRRVPALALAHQLVKQGRLGRIYHVRSAYLQDWAGPDTPMIWRFQGDVAGSGALGDLCAHGIDAVRFITGQEVEQVSGAMLETFIAERTVSTPGTGGAEISGRGAKTAKSRKAKSTVDDAVLFLARLSGGAVASFEATRLSTGDKNRNRLEIHGEKGALRFDFERMAELQWYDATLEGHLQGWSTINVSSGGDGHPYAKAWWPVAHAIGYEHTFVNQVADMLQVIAGGEPVVPLADFADAYQTQRVMAAVTASASNHCPVKLSEIK
jgi:predicted dehydrogenase